VHGLSEKRDDPQKTEVRWYQVWVEQGYFYANVQALGESFCIVIPPPNITGSLRLGHTLNTILQDTLVPLEALECLQHVVTTRNRPRRYRRAMGRRATIGTSGVNRYAYDREECLERVWG
jgi:valyl-tRNA synthetase